MTTTLQSGVGLHANAPTMLTITGGRKRLNSPEQT